MAEHLVFLGDIRGTKSELSRLGGPGRAVLGRRIEYLHDCFAAAFSEFSSRSRGLTAVTISDSVIAFWTDIREGLRFAIPFMTSLWARLDSSVVRFRGFLDVGEFVAETSALAYGLGLSSDRFRRIMPPSVALWSVAMAEAAHLPDGMFISQTLVPQLSNVVLDNSLYEAPPFQYRRLSL